MNLYSGSLHGLRQAQSTKQEAQPMVEMNTTPLIDVMLVLIVMLIITIPVQMHALALDMPSANDAVAVPVVRVQIDAAGFVTWDDERIGDVRRLDARLQAAAAQNPQPEIHLTPEPDTPYALVVSMTALAQKMGLRRVGVVN